jgi:hypothetical protein
MDKQAICSISQVSGLYQNSLTKELFQQLDNALIMMSL